jgi:hypothetical protein
MKNKLCIPGLVLLLLLLWSCGPTYPEDNVQILHPVPELNDRVLSYHALREEMHCEVKIEYDSAFTEICAHVELSGFIETTLDLELNDLGILGDALANDGLYSRNTFLTRIDSLEGGIHVLYQLFNNELNLKEAEDSIIIIANEAPIITEITMPDTIIRPTSGSKSLIISLSVDDPNGVYDVTNAFFQVKSNTTGLWSSDYAMNDAGELGDETAGDAIFSTGLEITSANSAATNYFRFRVKDTASNFSDWSLDSVVVR